MSAVTLVTDLISSVPDMGERVYGRSLAQALRERGSAVVSVDGPAPHAEHAVSRRRTLLSLRLRRLLKEANPEVVVYLQRSSLTPAGIVRCALLGLLAGCEVVPLVLQPYALSGPLRRLVGPLVPRRVLVASVSHAETLREWWPRTAATVLPAAIDAERFQPASDSQRAELRQRLALDAHRPVVLHVGHLKQSRNLDALASVARELGQSAQVVIVASSSTQPEEPLVQRLADAGVRVVTGYQDAVQEWYQAADVYLFPTRIESGSIAVPLSVLEALSCGMRVVTTPFGALPQLLEGNEAVEWVEHDGQFAQAVGHVLGDGRRVGRSYDVGWEELADRVLGLAGRRPA